MCGTEYNGSFSSRVHRRMILVSSRRHGGLSLQRMRTKGVGTAFCPTLVFHPRFAFCVLCAFCGSSIRSLCPLPYSRFSSAFNPLICVIRDSDKLPTPFAPLSPCIFGQARGPVPTIAIASAVSRLPDCFSRLPSPHLSSAILLLCLMCFLWLLHPRTLRSQFAE